MKKTKIICTIGPKTESIYMLKKLIKNGMDIARLNFSHGNHDEHYKRIQNIRYISKKINKKIPILLDTKGPEIRILTFDKKNKINLNKGQLFELHSDFIKGNENHVSITYKNLFKEIKINNKIYLDDGLIKMNVLNIKNNIIICKILNSGILEENKSLNVVGMNNNIKYITEKDKKDLVFACNNKIDFIAISFVRNHLDVMDIKNFLIKNNCENILIISKIESKSSIKEIDKIIKISDGIMIARGDLGINIPIENVIIEQKKIIKKCNLNNKPVITATHMLESMINNSYPTRAEAGDIANSILDGTDSVMLSGESAKGKYPIESIKIMNKICNKTDNLILNKFYNIKNIKNIFDLNMNYLSKIINKIKIKLIIIISNNYLLINNVRKYNPISLILNITTDEKILNKLFLTRGVISYKFNKIELNNNLFEFINDFIKKNNLLKINDKYILLYNIYSMECINTISYLKFK